MKELTATPFLDALDRAHIEETAIDTRLRVLLEKHGWQWTCQTPGSIWLYEKLLPDGRTLLVDQETALRCEREICGEHYEEGE